MIEDVFRVSNTLLNVQFDEDGHCKGIGFNKDSPFAAGPTIA